LKELKITIDSVNQKLANQKIILPPADNKPLNLLLETAIHDIKQIVSEQPRQVIHEKRFLFFPEYDAKSYYKIVYGRLLFWMMIFLIATYLFVLGKEFIEGLVR